MNAVTSSVAPSSGGVDCPPDDHKSLVERTLSVVSDVRAGEGTGALLLAVNLFFLLGGYYLLKTVRESLILAEGSAEVKAYSSAAQAVVLLGVVPLYGWISTRLNRKNLLRYTMLFFISNLLVFSAVGRVGFREGVAYFIWVGIFNLFSVAQLWSFATDLFSESQGKRLFPLLGVGASSGGVAGAWAAGKMIGPLGPYNVMLVAAGVLLVCVVLTRLAGSAVTKNACTAEKEKDVEKLSSEGGFQLLFRNRYLMLVAILTILLNVVSLSGDFIYSKLLLEHANATVGLSSSLMKVRTAYIGAAFASYYQWINLATFIIQTFVVSRVFKVIGVRGSLFVLPFISVATFISILWMPILKVVRIFKIAENSTNYSLQNTVRHALLLPTSREAKYKAKAAIETFCVRLGDVLQAGIIFVGTALHFSIRAFAGVTLIITALWFVVAMRLFLEHRRLLPAVH